MKLHFEPMELRLRENWSTSRTRGSRVARTVIVTLMDVDGRVGLGEAAPISRYGESVDSVESFLGKIDAARMDPHDVNGGMTYLDSVAAGEFAAKSALNCALLDLAAQRVAKPLHDFLGLRFRNNHHLTSFTIGIDTPGNIARKVEMADGFPILKIKLGAGHDEEIVAAVRSVAPEKRIRVDANEGWGTREQALDRIRHLAASGPVELVEQPLPADATADDLRWLNERSPLPLFADESFHTVADVEKCAGCFHGVNVKLSKTAGITGAMNALTAARSAGLKTMIGCMVESSVGITAAAHLAELADHLDLDGNLLIENDPFQGVRVEHGRLLFSSGSKRTGLVVEVRT